MDVHQYYGHDFCSAVTTIKFVSLQNKTEIKIKHAEICNNFQQLKCSCFSYAYKEFKPLSSKLQIHYETQNVKIKTDYL